jgi:hypothetical protein
MKRYRNISRDAGVRSYDYGPAWIHIRFTEGGTYEYTRRSVGPQNLKMMKHLADVGMGLTTFINQNPDAKHGFTRRIE